MSKTEENMDEETYVPLKEKRKALGRKRAFLILTLASLGAAFFFALVYALRIGGLPRMLFIVLCLALGYLIYENILKLKSIK